MISRWALTKNVLKDVFFLILYGKKTTIAACFFLDATEESLIPSMYFANYSKPKNLSVGKVCMKRFEFACMTILVLRLYQ